MGGWSEGAKEGRGVELGQQASLDAFNPERHATLIALIDRLT